MSQTRITPKQISNLPFVDVRSWGTFASAASAATNRATLDAAKASVITGGIAKSTPILLPDGVYPFDNTTVFEMVAGLRIVGNAQKSNFQSGPVLNPSVANGVFAATGNYVRSWELSGFAIDYNATVTAAVAQANANCIGINILDAGAPFSSGPSQFLVKNVAVRSPNIGFQDISVVSWDYLVEDFQVISPGDKGIKLDGVGTTKRFIRPMINSESIAPTGNDGIYINGQYTGVLIVHPMFESLHGRHINFVNSTVDIIGGYNEGMNVQIIGDKWIFSGGDYSVRDFIDNQTILKTVGKSIILVQGATRLTLDNIRQLDKSNAIGGAVYGLKVETATDATEVVVLGSPTLRTVMSGGPSTTISDPKGKIRVIEPSYKLTTPVTSVNAGGDQILMTYSMPGNKINDGGSIRIRAAGSISNGGGADGNKTVAFYFGSQFIVIKNAAGIEDWGIEATVIAQGGPTNQIIEYTFWVGSAQTKGQALYTTESALAAIVVKCVAVLAVPATNVVTQRYFELETL